MHDLVDAARHDHHEQETEPDDRSDQMSLHLHRVAQPREVQIARCREQRDREEDPVPDPAPRAHHGPERQDSSETPGDELHPSRWSIDAERELVRQALADAEQVVRLVLRCDLRRHVVPHGPHEAWREPHHGRELRQLSSARRPHPSVIQCRVEEELRAVVERTPPRPLAQRVAEWHAETDVVLGEVVVHQHALTDHVQRGVLIATRGRLTGEHEEEHEPHRERSRAKCATHRRVHGPPRPCCYEGGRYGDRHRDDDVRVAGECPQSGHHPG